MQCKVTRQIGSPPLVGLLNFPARPLPPGAMFVALAGTKEYDIARKIPYLVTAVAVLDAGPRGEDGRRQSKPVHGQERVCGDGSGQVPLRRIGLSVTLI